MKTLAFIAAVILPFWNIPLLWRMEKRRSSADISCWWACGVETCLLLMFPAALNSTDIVYKTFSIINIIFFTAIVVEVMRFRSPLRDGKSQGLSSSLERDSQIRRPQ